MGHSQVSDAEISLLRKLDSAKNSTSIARHFAPLYFDVTSRAAEFYLHDKESAKKFIQRFETNFAGYFFRSVEAFKSGIEIPEVWKAYFSDTSLSPLQYQLLGINAHINGDIWQALTTEFSLQEIQANKKSYFDFQKGLVKEYRDFYERSVRLNSTTTLLNKVTLGLDKLYGKTMLIRWRKRQMQMAILYFTDHARFENKLYKLHKKMDHINRLILHNL